ncbi:amidophosphoribosyltransferase [Sedimentibacter saalensis]|jgi:amidophosphoribosyltransferase|uniref:Amidophosphoribosyltransferase n=2 Tax=Sedimentibacter TaxID=190972 RepID=A0A562JII1_9FIRM|nr:amidophosphoribosyltransferase [Sedimentibacter saalensis]MEA5094624.1 amidophosphoribosyltransferase [Sedimentibacter saalensis]TWH82704.1 amidophosphoribosyltransferase [Sedimentibacter saalensis]
MQDIILDDKLHEECGVVGVFSGNPDITSQLIYYGLFALQHRGQESAGIAINTGGKIQFHKNMGLVSDVMTSDVIQRLSGGIAIGHVRYSTSGGSEIENAQPLVVRYKNGTLALAHNGNLVNADSLRNILEDSGVIFQTSIDTEVVANMIARNANGDVLKSIKNVMEIIKGAFAFVIATEKQLIGVRDHFGLRPLCLGQRPDGGYLLASESCAINAMGGEFIRDIEPGEIIIIDENGIESIKSSKYAQQKSCIFEYVYFARPDSTIDGVNVYQSRYNAGRILAQEAPVKADLVFCVPDSGTPAAIGYGNELGIPYGLGLIKNRYAKRTFIEPSQELREEGVKTKLSVNKELVKDKVVVMIDDSIVRGTTTRQLAQMVRDAGAKEVHVRIASPPVTHSCFFGIDTPFRSYLIGANKSVDEMKDYIKADSLHFLSMEGLIKSTGSDRGFCLACLNGDYPMEVPKFD